jgi:diacylglycerol kinase family enzyme
MNITLMYNPNAGEKDLNLDKLVKGLSSRGAEVRLQSTKEDNYELALEEKADFILIAGGDGTVEKLAKKLVFKNIPIAILPVGSANNIASSLDVEATLDGIFGSWHSKDFRKFSVGMVEVEQNKSYFFESVGWGLFSEALLKSQTEKKNPMKYISSRQKDKVESGLDKLSQCLDDLQASYYEIFLDGEDHSGHYLWVEIMNTQSMGPRLQLAPEARHDDEFLDVVMVKKGDLDLLKKFIELDSHKGAHNFFKSQKSKHVKVKTHVKPHIDDEIPKEKYWCEKWIEIGLFSRFFWVINAYSP